MPTTLINHTATLHRVQLRPPRVEKTRNVGTHKLWLNAWGESRLCCPCCTEHYENGDFVALDAHFENANHLIPAHAVRPPVIGQALAAVEPPADVAFSAVEAPAEEAPAVAEAPAEETPAVVEAPVPNVVANAREEVVPALCLPLTYLVPITREQENSIWDFSGIGNAETRQRLHILARCRIPSYARKRPDWELRLENERLENHQRRQDEYY